MFTGKEYLPAFEQKFPGKKKRKTAWAGGGEADPKELSRNHLGKQ